ncbi:MULTISPECIES: hypothetical protein [unclassified Cryobacterium]|uniref:hypothetical protein n=1 Tax=unclassified Cryobacterium TaxID=2649013 RepID=UPI001445CC15|nr:MULTISPECIES: hypothetical protein [unclassified Cryobacterium]
MRAQDIIADWPYESREAAQIVIEEHGEPHESAPSMLLWHNVGLTKRLTAWRDFAQHDFPAPHTDSVTTTVDYAVPTPFIAELAEFDGSVTVARTAGEVSATCHDEQANFLALNLMVDIVSGEKTAEEAREYYAKEFLDYRRGLPTPYMQKLRFRVEGEAADPDERILSDEQLEAAEREGT